MKIKNVILKENEKFILEAKRSNSILLWVFLLIVIFIIVSFNYIFFGQNGLLYDCQSKLDFVITLCFEIIFTLIFVLIVTMFFYSLFTIKIYITNQRIVVRTNSNFCKFLNQSFELNKLELLGFNEKTKIIKFIIFNKDNKIETRIFGNLLEPKKIYEVILALQQNIN